MQTIIRYPARYTDKRGDAIWDHARTADRAGTAGEAEGVMAKPKMRS